MPVHVSSSSQLKAPDPDTHRHERMRQLVAQVKQLEASCASRVSAAATARSKAEAKAEADFAKAKLQAEARLAARNAELDATLAQARDTVKAAEAHVDSCLRSCVIPALPAAEGEARGRVIALPAAPERELDRLRQSASDTADLVRRGQASRRYWKPIVFAPLALGLGLLARYPYLAPVAFPGVPLAWLIWVTVRVRSHVASLRETRRRVRQLGHAWLAAVEKRSASSRQSAERESADAVASADRHRQQAMDEAEREGRAAAEAVRSSLRAPLRAIREEAVALASGLVGANWQNAAWSEWSPAAASDSAVRLGVVEVPAPTIQALLPQEPPLRLPAFLQFRGGRGMLLKARGHRQYANEVVQAAVFRLLAMIPPGKVRFLFIDPLGLGQNVAAFMELQEYDDSLVTGKAWTEPQQIEKCLADVTEHMETVIQKYLRQDFADIEAYNAKSGEVTEPYRVVVAFDFPVSFTEAAAKRLVSIVRNGPRCGVYAFIVVDEAQPMPHGFSLGDLEQFTVVLMAQGRTIEGTGFEPTLQAEALFDIHLEAFEAGRRSEVVEAVKRLTSFGHARAALLVDMVPQVLVRRVAREEVAAIVGTVQAAGGTARVSPAG